MGKTPIEWADHSINPLRARNLETGKVGHFCVKVSAGCKNCYSSKLQSPHLTNIQFLVENRPKVELFLEEKALQEVLRRRKPTRYFWCDMTDLFWEEYPDEWLDRCFAVMALTPWHTHMVLTKRAGRMLTYFTSVTFERWRHWMNLAADGREHRVGNYSLTSIAHRAKNGTKHEFQRVSGPPLPNVHLGVSVENQETADARIPLLLQTPAAVRFVSYEPALGPVDFTRIDYRQQLRDVLVKFARWSAKEDGDDDEAAAMEAAAAIPEYLADPSDTPVLNVLTGEWFDGWDSGGDGKKLDQIIVGGESGPGARPFQAEWAQSTAEQCRASGTAFFMKQFGANAWQGGDNGTLRTKMPFRDKKGGDISEFPRWAQVREFPGVSA